MLEITVAGAPLRLLHRRAAFLPESGTLLVADAHIGKAHSFRRLGVPVPRGTTAESLHRLSDLLAETGARRVVFLGDLLHSAQGRSAAVSAEVSAWRERHAELEVTLVRGNHDRHAGDPPSEWRVDCVDEPLHLAPFALVHHPLAVPGAYALAGHLHPAALVGARAGERLRLPCFHFGAGVGVLPAFGAFTGMQVLPRLPGDRVFVVADDTVRHLNS